MEDMELVQASGLKPAVEALRRRGIAVERYLERNGIPSNFVELPYAPLPKRQRLWRFLEDVEQSEGIETLGFLMGDAMDLADVGPFGAKMMKADTLLDAFIVLHHNIGNFAQKNTIDLERVGTEGWILCDSYRKTCRPADHIVAAFLIAIIRLAAGPDWRPGKIRLQTGPVAALRQLPLLTDCEFEFNCAHAGVAFPVDFLNRKLVGYDPEDPPESIRLTPLPDSHQLSDALRVIIATLLPFRGPPSAEEAAEMAGVSRATLFRRLAAEGTGYKRLVEEVRFKAARTYLERPEFSIKDVSYLLGYSVPNNFIRAFRNHAGVTPSQYRREDIGA